MAATGNSKNNHEFFGVGSHDSNTFSASDKNYVHGIVHRIRFEMFLIT